MNKVWQSSDQKPIARTMNRVPFAVGLSGFHKTTRQVMDYKAA